MAAHPFLFVVGEMDKCKKKKEKEVIDLDV